jgi:beta-glucosidase
MTPFPTRAIAAALGLLALPAARAEAPALYQDKAAPVEARVNDLLGRLTMDEELSIIGGDRDFYIRPIARLGLPEIKMADGPLGVRNYGPSTAYPATIGLAAAWDGDLARQFGAAVGSDARARGVNIMLGPAVNINRVPQNGRNFEYLSEDPYLAGAVATQIVEGIQSQGVVATVKHYAANNQETDRGTIDVRVSERALREIYLPAFRAAVEGGHAWAVMSAYNRVNGDYCTANNWLNNTVLKGDWAFKGVLMSDWGAAHETLGVTNGGLDLEMPSGQFMNPSTLKPLLASDAVSPATIEDKVRRILRLEIANGFLDRPQEISSIPKDDPRSDAVALKIAREAVVLLKNDHGALPLTGRKIKRIVVLGPNSSDLPAGGGSSHVEPFHYVSVVEGLGQAAPKAHIEVIPGPGPALLGRLMATTTYEGPLKLEFMSGDWKTRRVIASQSDTRIDHDWSGGAPAQGVDLATYWARWTGTIRAPSTGKYIFMVQNHGNVNVQVGGKEIIESWSNPDDTLFAEVSLEAGKSYPLALEVRYDNQGSPAVRFAWGAVPPLLTGEEAARVRAADAVVVCVGYNIMLEGEGADRAYELPNDQPELIRRAVALNPRTIVVVNSGGVVATADWIGQVPAVLQAWYPGQEGGRAVADIIMGAVNPSGRLPITYEKRVEDSPSHGNYPGSNGTVKYAEGILVGYRWFDAKGVAPLYPFGFGLTYTTFSYDKLHIEPTGDGRWSVTFQVTNNGSRTGTEVSQVYVSPPVTSRAGRPIRELRGFSRESLETDQSISVTIILDRSAFSYFDESKHEWVVEPGSYTIEVGSSSRDIILTGPVALP